MGARASQDRSEPLPPVGIPLIDDDTTAVPLVLPNDGNDNVSGGTPAAAAPVGRGPLAGDSGGVSSA
jgi:hypothetical protein